MFTAIDTGTTNTRVYNIDRGKIMARTYRNVGVRDTAIRGSKDKLKLGIIECFDETMH